jgi:uncharacterized peroxidase-related enzyme
VSLVSRVEAEDLPEDLGAIYRRYVASYGDFANQAAALAHVPEAVRHIMPMLMEMKAAARLKPRHLELVLVAVSQLNACHYCVAHHAPKLEVTGLSAAGVARLLEFADHPELDAADKAIVEYATYVTRDANRIPARVMAAMREHFTEAQLVELTFRIALTTFFNKFTEALQIEEEGVPV